MPVTPMIILMALIVILLIILMIQITGLKKSGRDSNMSDEFYRNRKELNEKIDSVSERMDRQLKASYDAQDKRLADMSTRLSNMAVENEQKLENIRNTMEKNIKSMADDNNK